jgi:tRNA A-37 threonylcarbamoyl transferase component Bud32
MNRKKKSLYKLKTNDKIITNLKKQNISTYQKKSSVSNISFNKEKERNISFLKVNQERKKSFAGNETDKEKEKEPKKDSLTTIKEDKKLKKNNCFNFLHHYLLNTVSTKNKIVLKKPEDKTFSSYYQKSEKDRTSKSKSKSKNKNFNINKRYSLFNRNCVLKSDNHAKTREEFSALKIDDKIMKRTPSLGNNRIICHISNMSSLSNIKSTKIFNGKIDDYLITKELGKGSYASVKLAVHKNNKNKYAIKIYSRESLLDPQKRNTIKNEINILKQLDNVNVMKLYEDINTPKYLYLVMEYINGISLLETIKKDKNHYFEEKRAIKIFIQIVKGISYCQSKNICHRDIKLENILLINNDIVKIIDFGFAVKTNKETYQKLFCGTPSYMAPEIVNKEKYIAQYSDLWSLGVLFFAMLYGRFPFRAKTQEELFVKINEANVIFPDDIEVNYKIKDLLRKIFVVIPTQRISLNEILNELTLFDNENLNEKDN